jgi:hypothetical protein
MSKKEILFLLKGKMAFKSLAQEIKYKLEATDCKLPRLN